MKEPKDQKSDEAREPQIPKQIDLFHRAIEELDDVTQKLFERIKPVLIERPVNAEENNKIVETKFSPLAGTIDQLCTRVKMVNQALKDNLNRLEL